MEKPYVISEELDMIDSSYIQNNNVNEFREGLDTDLRNMNKDTVWVSSSDIRQGLEKVAGRTSVPIVSLDDRYMSSADIMVGISRGVDQNLNDVGYMPRVGYPSICEQLDKVTRLGSEVVLVDDVIFSGDMILSIVQELQRRKVKVGAVACGVLIGEGAAKINASGIDINAVRAFDDVEDEICERDFAVVPGSGRRIESVGANALYFSSQFGKPAKWASIPDGSVNEFSANSFVRSANLVNLSVNMQTIGRFYGLRYNGNARQILLNNVAQLERTN